MLRARPEGEDHQYQRDHDQENVDPLMRLIGVWIDSRRHFRLGGRPGEGEGFSFSEDGFHHWESRKAMSQRRSACER